MLELGINTNCQCGENFDEIIESIKQVGFPCVMVAFDNNDDEYKLKKAKELGLIVSYVHLFYRYGNNVWVVGKSADEYMNNVIKQIELCGKYDIKKVIFHATWGSPNDMAIKPNKNGLNNIKKILEVATKNNIVVALENTDKHSIKYIDYLFNNIKSNNLAFCFDIGHHNLYCKKTNIVKKYSKRLAAIHLHDNMGDWKEGLDFTRDMHILPFDGNVDYEKQIKFLSKTNYNDAVMIEVHKSGVCVPPIYDSLSNIEYLKEVYNRAEKIRSMIEKNRE